jgi:hypothetical protein
MLDLQSVKMPSAFIAIVLSLSIAAVCSASEPDRLEGCFSKSTPMTREEVKCRVMISLEHSFSIEIKYFLESESDYLLWQIDEVVYKLMENWAECQVSAMIAFADTRQDIPLNLLLTSLAGEEMSEDDFLWLRAQLEVGELGDVIEHCKEEFREELMGYKSEP